MTWLEINEPKDSDIHTIADFLEILCITSIDREVTFDDLEDHLSDYFSTLMNNEDKRFDVEEQICWRLEAFSDFYPFEKDENSIRLQSSLSTEKRVYLFLLLSANLPFVSQSLRNDYTNHFETLSLMSLKELLGPRAKSYQFARNEQEFPGQKHDRMNEVFRKIGCIGLCKKEDFNKYDSGDGGIDLVSSYEADQYEQGNIISVLAQCACSRSDWSKKQSDASHDKLEPLAQVTNRWNNMIFIPICYRDNKGKWCSKSKVYKNILFDRLRIMKFLPQNDSINFNFPESFERMLDFTRSITE